MGLGDPTTYIYQVIFDQNDSSGTNIIQHFIMHVLVLCIKLNSFVANMFYACSLIYNTAVPFSMYHNKYFISLHTRTTMFASGDGN